MICQGCRQTLLLRLRTSNRIPIGSIRCASTVPSTPNNTHSQPLEYTILSNPPLAVSSSKPASSQPLSASDSQPDADAAGAKKSAKLKGSIAGGAALKGLGYLKAKPTVLAKEDEEYPSWLWGLIEESNTETKVDFAAMTKRQRAKHDRRQERLTKNLPKQVPLHEQSTDLTQPGDDAETSLARRQEITKSSREARRKEIRESNFLKSM